MTKPDHPDMEIDANLIRQAIDCHRLPDFDGDDPEIDQLINSLDQIQVAALHQDIWVLVRHAPPEQPRKPRVVHNA